MGFVERDGLYIERKWVEEKWRWVGDYMNLHVVYKETEKVYLESQRGKSRNILKTVVCVGLI